jgi:dihydroxyacetone kinase
METGADRQAFYNNRDDLVVDSMDGAIFSSANLGRFEGTPDIKVLLRTDWDKDREGAGQVALISGGGSGHEPAHGGFVGKGMLTAAVLGDVFASPGVDAILAAILGVTGEAGCLLIIKNYTGDRIAFGLAREKAKSHGLKVEMVIVGDDVSLKVAQPRGIAGTLFIHKIAGAIAESGGSLAAIHREAEAAANSLASYGVALTTCRIPGTKKTEVLAGGEMELGLGIHGEPGAKKALVTPVASIVNTMVAELQNHLQGESSLAVLINNLGAVSNLEMGIIVKSLMDSPLGERISLLFGPHHLMTSLDMNGFSLSCLPLSNALKEHLLIPVPNVPAWKPGVSPLLKVRPLPLGIGRTFTPSKNPQVLARIERICHALIAAKSELNLMDRAVGDGDTGTTFAKGAKKILLDIPRLPLNQPRELALALGELLSKSVGGSSGVLLSIFFTAAAAGMDKDALWSKKALTKGVDGMSHYGGAKLGDRTMLDAMIPALHVWEKGLLQAAKAAEEGMENTKTMEKASAGRSSYVPKEELRGRPDPGAFGIMLILKACL